VHLAFLGNAGAARASYHGSVSSIEPSARKINAKIVYYGPGLGGKTTSLQAVYAVVNPRVRNPMISLATGADRTLYFDFFPLQLPKIRGYRVKLHLYTVPGQVHYNSTRKLVLSGADGVVFVADSQPDRLSANTESMANLAENLKEQGDDLERIPLVLQYNKRDAPHAISVAELDRALNPRGLPVFETVATQNAGVFDALKEITRQVLRLLAKAGFSAPSRPSTDTGASAVEDAATPVSISRIQDFPMALQRNESTEMPAVKVAASAPSPQARNGCWMSDLIVAPWLRDLATQSALAIEKGNWHEAVETSRRGLRTLSTMVAGAHAEEDGWSVAALLLGVSGRRYLQFQQLVQRTAHGGAVSREDALFSLFFLLDAGLRWQEEEQLSFKTDESKTVEPVQRPERA
jgi:signal recognition particle receptor subunit beta